MSRIVGSFSVKSLARRTVVEGAASAFDLRGDTRRQYWWAASDREADAKAILDDWRAVGADLWHAFEAAGVPRSGDDHEEGKRIDELPQVTIRRSRHA